MVTLIYCLVINGFNLNAYIYCSCQDVSGGYDAYHIAGRRQCKGGSK